MTDLDLAVIGNGSLSALVDDQGAVVWCCPTRFDGDPFFHRLVGQREGRGAFEIELDGLSGREQSYVPNTAVLRTVLRSRDGSEVELMDFAPRFRQYERMFRPTSLVRLIRPLRGAPRIRIRIRPSHTYGAEPVPTTRGSNHIRYVTPEVILRLTTNAAVSYVLEETAFILQEPVALLLGPDEPLTRPVLETAHHFLSKTHEYWLEFSRHLSIPFEWQQAVLRAAITLKLCSSDETGAIVAAMTTSIPEAPHSERNWDYRYCWLRDAYFVVHALNRLGATDTLEAYIRYVGNLIAWAEDGYLQPVYGVGLESRLEERQIQGLEGYRGMGPVRVGNLAYQQIQNDVYGSAILAVTHIFFDERLVNPGRERLFDWLEKLGHQAVRRYREPDAGLWELRHQQCVHTFSSVMCWAACDRLARIAERIGRGERAAFWREKADGMHGEIEKNAWSDREGRFASTWGGDGADASLFLLHDLGFLSKDDERFAATVEGLEKTLRVGDLVFRYTEDEFGRPETAFTVCTFWYIDALAALGRVQEARALFERLLERRNPLGLLSEDLHPDTGELWGNFPQTYSMVGLINSAMRLSRGWHEAF